MIVPSTALTRARRSPRPRRQLQRRDRLRARDDVPERCDAVRPRRPDERRDRQHDDRRRGSGHEAEREGRLRPPRSDVLATRRATRAACAALARGRPPDGLLDLRPSARCSGRTTSCRRAASRRCILSSTLKMPGRVGTCPRTSRRPSCRPGGSRTARTGPAPASLFTNRMNLFAMSLFGLALSTAIGSSISIDLARDHVLDVLAVQPRVDRLALVGDQHVALAREERVRGVAAGRVLRDDVLEQLLHVARRLLVGLAEPALRAVGGEDVPLRRAGAERVRRDHLHARAHQVVPRLDVLRVAGAHGEDDDACRRRCRRSSAGSTSSRRARRRRAG